jgi:hypothetical protein
VVNFLAAYGKHPTILAATTLEEKRDAAMLLMVAVASGVTGAAMRPILVKILPRRTLLLASMCVGAQHRILQMKPTPKITTETNT